MKGFKQFILRGNVLDLAVAVVIGAAFGAVVTALVKDLITPLVAAVAGVSPEEVRVGQPVRAVFREVAEGVTLPYFEPAARREAEDSGSLATS